MGPSLDATHVRILGVDYLHVRLEGHDDLYVTHFGAQSLQHLLPENWWEREWFEANREPLPGSSTIYRVRTKEVGGAPKDLVIKWSRVGQDIPGDTAHGPHLGEFNSPFEEFALVLEMRDARHESPGVIRTHRPLAIFCPQRRVALWRTGRKEHKFERKRRDHVEIELDAFRHYVLIYEWIKGVDITHTSLPAPQVEGLTLAAEADVRRKGFVVADRKPHHVIVRPDSTGAPRRNSRGRIPYALVDFELLRRTPERDQQVMQRRRSEYLTHQRDRFTAHPTEELPEHLTRATVLSVPYVMGRVESTNGRLWVVGQDPDLFDYFLPERWMWTPRERLSATHSVFHTRTKDNVHLVWKASRVGDSPAVSPNGTNAQRIFEHGFNSPFEEFSFALELLDCGVNVIFPRAIYMAPPDPLRPGHAADRRRYTTHDPLRLDDGSPILSPFSKYVVVWGYWNGPDDRLAAKDGDYVMPINMADAQAKGIIGQVEAAALAQRKEARLARAGFEDLDLRPEHLLLSLNPQGEPVQSDNAMPELRVCSLDLLRRITAEASSDAPG